MSTNANSFFADDKSRAAGAAVETTNELPIAYIYNDSDNQGRTGGLFINLRDLPPDIEIDKDLVTEFQTEHPDTSAPGGFKRESGILLPKYHLVLVAFDHDDQGRAQAWKKSDTYQGQTKDKWAFYCVAGVMQAWSNARPFMIKYGGATNAIGMSQHVRNFDRYIVGEATRIIRASNSEAPPASRNQFMLPVSHQARRVGTPPNQSWACPVVEYEEAGLRIDANGRRSGVSILKKYADDEALLKALFIPKMEQYRDRALKAMEWTETYKTLVHVSGESAGTQAGSEHFTDDEKLSITEEMIGRVNELVAQSGANLDQEIQVLRGSNTLKGGDDKSSILSLSQAGARLVINHLTELARARSGQQQAPAQTQVQAPAETAAPAAKTSLW